MKKDIFAKEKLPPTTPHEEESAKRNAALVKECRKGNDTATAQLYTLYFDKLVICCRKYYPDKQDAEDAAQDQLLAAFAYIRSGKFPKSASFELWLYKCAKHKCINDYKRKKIEFVKLETVLHEFAIIETSMEESLFAIVDGILKKEIKALSKEDRKMIRMKVKNNFSWKKIAKVLHKTEKSLSQRYYRILEMLKNVLQKNRIIEKLFSF